MRVLVRMRSVLADESGVTAIEYGLLAGLIAVVIVGTVAALGSDVGTMYTNICTQVVGAINGGSC